MLYLIQSLVPRPLHRAALKGAHRVRHRWRLWRKVQLDGVSVILRSRAGEILLVRHAYGPQVWTLPGGGMKRGEEPVETARREMQEELGAVLVDARYLGFVDETLSGSPHRAHVVIAGLDAPPAADRREIESAAFFALDALPQPLSTLAATRIALLGQAGAGTGSR
ncbi:NUDIX domain-containing protein [Altererythrobacter sp. MTPC7]|uniref:NUDIX domain-containing protein n=1 Tax=Altererythrobacter sp. MTPC7 TaxID=3056567 RepID=UPI0036F42637